MAFSYLNEDGSATVTGSHVERHRFFHYQRLLASDLQGLESFHREMRELHNRSLHQPGIGNGFAVSGEPGDRKVTIGPGYALDADGHEIVLTRSRLEPVPPVAAGDDGGSAFFHLTVSYPSDDDLEEAETRQGLCQTQGTVRLREEPVFCWVRLTRDGTGKLRPADDRLDSDIAEARKIVLARVEIRDCRLEKKPFVAQRRNARPATGPLIVCGRDELPDWTVTVQIGGGGLSTSPTFFLTAAVDTSEAGFRAQPHYWARIDGPRTLATSGGTLFADGLVSIEPSRADTFTIRVFLVLSDPSLVDETPENQRAALFAGWKIEWMGVE